MTPIDIERSVLGRVSDVHSGNAAWGSPDDFDINNENITDWIEAHLDMLNEGASRKGNQEIVPFRCVVKCWSRSGENFQAARVTASNLRQALRHNEIEILDSSDEEDPDPEVVGYARLYEPAVSVEEAAKGFQLVLLLVEGMAQQA